MSNSAKLKPNQILLTFKDEGEAEYIRLICRRKCMDLESYISDNFEWDDTPYCMRVGGEITADVCEGCDYADRCLDAVSAKNIGAMPESEVR